MTAKPQPLRAAIEVVPATAAQQPILANLLELYIYDFSGFHDVAIGPDGRFGYQELPLYWTEAGRHPFLIRVDGELAGFVLVMSEPQQSGPAYDPAWDMDEFFVLRAYRRMGVGTAAAHAVWTRFPGPWTVRVLEANAGAFGFWEQAIAQFLGKPVHAECSTKGRHTRYLFRFDSRAPAKPPATA